MYTFLYINIYFYSVWFVTGAAKWYFLWWANRVKHMIAEDLAIILINNKYSLFSEKNKWEEDISNDNEMQVHF